MKKLAQEEFFTIEAGYENCEKSLSLQIPNSLYCDFENCFNSHEGEETLSELFETYHTLTVKQKEILQLSIYDKSKDIRDVKDLVIMMRALKKVFFECGC